jgi:Thaumatin family
VGDSRGFFRVRGWAVVATVAVMIFCGGAGTRADAAGSAASPAQVMTAAADKAPPACPSGSRALTFTNDCTKDIYLGEGLSSPNLQSTSTCKLDTDCNPSANEDCVNGLCTEVCTTSSNCGANQACLPTTQTNAAGTTVSECFFKNLEPMASATPSSGSYWQLPAQGGQAVICVPEGPTSAPGPTGPAATGIEGASCKSNADCISNTCAGGASLARLCKSSDTNCKCAAVFTWSGNFWGRTDCSGVDVADNQLTCETGNCAAANGQPGSLDCNSAPTVGPIGQQNPAFLGEFTLEVPPREGYNTGAQDYYDNSYVSGFNVGYSIVPVPGSYSPKYTSVAPRLCAPAGVASVDSSGNPVTYCSFDLISGAKTCPADLQYLDSSNNLVGCWAPTQACSSATTQQQANLGCTSQVPFLCTQATDCPYNAGGTQTMTCDLSEGQAFGQCECGTNSDCPTGFSCQGTPGICTNTGAASSTWADLFGCANFFNLSPYPSTTNITDTGIVCGCPAWSPDGTCNAHNINWEQVPVGSTQAVAAPAPTTSTGDYYQAFHNACPVSYTYPYDDEAALFGCTNNGHTVGPSYDITFCPAATGPTPTATATPTATPTSTSSATATATATPTATATSTASATATPTPTSTATATSTASATPTATPTPGGSVHCTPNFYLSSPTGTVVFPSLKYPNGATEDVEIYNGAGAALKLSYSFQGFANDFQVTGGSCMSSNRLSAGNTCKYLVTFKPVNHQASGGVTSNMVVKGTFKRGVCPAGDYQMTSPELQADVAK